MSDLRLQVRFAMRAVVEAFGCLDAAAETINARWGGGANKGLLSRKLSGSLDFTVADVVALEDAGGRYPVTRILARRLEKQHECEAGCLVSQTSVIAKECGEAMAAILAATQSASANQKAEAMIETRQAIEVLQQALAILEKQEKG